MPQQVSLSRRDLIFIDQSYFCSAACATPTFGNYVPPVPFGLPTPCYVSVLGKELLSECLLIPPTPAKN